MSSDKNATKVQSWNDFVKENLDLGDNDGDFKYGLSGACLSTKQGQPVFSHGELCYLKQTHMQYFVSLFNPKCKSTDECSNSEVSLPGTTLKFKVIQRTFTKIYGTACDQNGTGLLINLLPVGILVCLFHHPFTWQSAVKQVESFCDKLNR